ncbi:MAG TPA: type II toxin-antitoxin system VapB family antitoxin [Thermoanaerobaculia bacterium]|nr:type II toxin-antitoxin system VapB family antitoxin [Thermoanaerobaculia bacterium]
MKRTNVVLDEELLEQARRVTGERTYSATVNKALAELVRKAKLKESFEKMYAGGDLFWPGYLEEIRPNSYAAIEARRRKRVAAKEHRAPRKKASRRGAR